MEKNGFGTLVRTRTLLFHKPCAVAQLGDLFGCVNTRCALQKSPTQLSNPKLHLRLRKQALQDSNAIWNKTSCAYSKNAIGSVSSAAQNNSASSASVSVKLLRRHADNGSADCNVLEKARKWQESDGYVAENAVIYKMTAARTTGIAQMVEVGWRRLVWGCKVVRLNGVIFSQLLVAFLNQCSLHKALHTVFKQAQLIDLYTFFNGSGLLKIRRFVNNGRTGSIPVSGTN
jgi:hypothetical protein